MLYALIVLAAVCVCNSVAIVVLARRSKPRGMTYQDLKHSMDVQRYLDKLNSTGARMSEHYRNTFGLEK